MMKLILGLFIGFFGFTGFGQDPLVATAEISSPSYCRIFGYQSGGGVVTGYATGGVADYTTQWTELATGDNVPFSTWGGRNPGYYEFMVTDDMGTIARDTVFLDSINPIASFDVISDDLSPIPDGYVGFAPATVTFEVTSQYVTNPFDEFGDATHFFKPRNFEDWQIAGGDDVEYSYTYNYGGVHNAILISINKNGCADTTAVTIGLFGELGLGEGNLGNFNVYSNTDEIIIKQSGFQNGLRFNLYSLSGKQIKTYQVTDSETHLAKPNSTGVYIYEIIDINSGKALHSAKLNL